MIQKLNYFLLLFVNILYSQQHTKLTGTIYNTDSIAISRATLTLYPSEKTYITNDQGQFDIDTTKDEMVLISHITCVSKRIPIEKGKQEYTIYLEKRVDLLEVVDLNKRTLTGSLQFDAKSIDTQTDTLQLGELQAYVNRPKPVPELKAYGWDFQGDLGPLFRLLKRKKLNQFKRWDALEDKEKLSQELKNRDNLNFILTHFKLNEAEELAILLHECSIGLKQASVLFREELIEKLNECLQKKEN